MSKKIILLLLVLSSGLAKATTYTQTWSNLTSVTNASGVLTKTTAAGWNNAGARARNTLMANVDGWMEFTIDQKATTANYMVGFSAINNVYIQSAIDFGVEVSSQNGVVNLLAHEGSATGTDLGTVVIGDVIRVGREGGLIKYYKNGAEIRSVTGDATKYYITKVLINIGKTATIGTSYDVLNETGEIPNALEQAALKDMYDNLGGSAWTNSPYWPTTGTLPVNSMNNYGVWIQNGDVTRIMLQSCNVTGELPSSIGNLSKLQYVFLMTNKLSGALPSSMGNLAELGYLYMEYNQLTGAIPPSFGNMTNLQLLHLNTNQLTSYPVELNKLSKLTDLTISANLFTSMPDLSGMTKLTRMYLGSCPYTAAPFPSWVLSMPQLTGLSLTSARLTGSIPDDIGTSLPLLTNLDLSSNPLSGSIPPSIGNLTKLQYLKIVGSQLTGSIPDVFGNMKDLLSINLSINQLTGSIPSSIGSCTKLITLDLSSNKLTGSIPASIGSTNLVNLFLYTNQLSGEIPTELGKLINLTNLQLQTNQLTGSIPSSLGDLINLQYFWLANNKLTGSIPASLGKLTKVIDFYLSSNQLTGTIPSTLGNLNLVQRFCLNDNKLSGAVPSSLSGLSSAWLFYLYNNQLSGDFPDIFSGLKKLNVLYAYNNQFTGAIPSSIGNCTTLAAASFYTNKITSLPSSMLTLPVLSLINFYDNEIVSIPDFSTAVNKANLTLNIYNNRLDYSQLELTQGKGIKTVTNYPQKDIVDIDFVSLITGSSLTIAARNPGQYSTIYWDKLNGTTWTNVNSSDADATLKTYNRTSAALTDVGIYRWRMTNTLVGGTIKSGNISIETGLVPDAVEFAALKDLYDGLGGTTWTNKTNWPTSWTTVATATQMDTWNGIDISNGDISAINLFQNNLAGSIPSSISNLKGVKVIDFQNNAISGEIPASMMTMTGLTNLRLYNNQLTGAIPTTIGSLTNLTELSLSKNKFTGEIPSGIGSLIKLTSLSLNLNADLSGPLPSTFYQLINLTDLNISDTKIDGQLSEDIGAFTHLKNFYGYRNKWSGALPASLGSIQSLENLQLNGNTFSGAIPDNWRHLTSLKTLYVNQNQLTGDVPSWLGELTSLQVLSIGDNPMQGTIPTGLNSLANLTTLSMPNLNLQGTIPSDLMNKSTLKEIHLNGNQLTNFPDISARTDKASLIITIQNNQIPIPDIARYFTAQATQPFNTFIYAPQASTLVVPTLLKIDVSESLTIEVPSGGAQGVYTWEKLQSNAWVNVNSLNQSSTPNIFLITHVKVTDAGKYRSTVTNSWAPGLNYQTITETDVHDPIKDAMDMWGFQYKYDARNRMIAKKVPGADWIYMVYDLRDRLVLTQDGEQRKGKKWTFTKYDELNRPIITGLYTLRASDAPFDQQAMSGLVSTVNFFEIYNGDVINHGYTNTVFSTTNFPGTFEVLTVAYYDNYDFKDDTATKILNDSRYNYKSDEYIEQYKYDANGNSLPKVIGRVTGSKTKNLGDNTFLWSVHYYDDKYRVVQTVADNVRSGVDRSTSVYDFVGRARKTKTIHNISATAPQTIARTFEYDHVGRLKWIKHSVNGATNGADDVVLVKNEYNELGQLIDKKLHSTDTDAKDAKQSVDYRYNIRGWLISVNDVEAPEASDLFSMNLNYDAPTILGGAAQYNGNISEMLWKGPDAKANSYGYTYDPMNRLVEAKYYNASDPLKNGRFNEKIWDEANNKSGYDLNGNIKFLARSGKTGIDAALGITTYGEMDNLTYKYTGNQLLRVSETAIKTQGFIDGANTDDDYSYDANGNMSFDKNKSITGETTANDNSVITYNHLNLPEKVVKSTGEYVINSYDATGRKLRQEVFDKNNKPTKKADYIGEFFYEDDVLQFINHEEGRIVMTGPKPEYQYHLKDHLGNVRLTFTSKEDQEENTATLEAASLSDEQTKFLNIDKARRINSAIFDHTYDNQTPPADGTFAVRLSGTTTDGQTQEKIGLVRSLSVMPGDKITVEVYAKYVDLNNSNLNSTVRSLVTNIAAGTATAGTVVDGNHYGTSAAATFPYGGDLADEKANDTHGGPKAYLNYLVFDKDYNFIRSKSDYKKVNTDASEDGTTITILNPEGKAHQQLTASIDIAEEGYVYIYLSNEEETPVEVYFDDFKVTQQKSAVIQTQDYYPFGLTCNSFTRDNIVPQNFKFNGKEEQNELSLNWLNYGARMYMPEIGRWGVIDPLAEKMRRWSPYNYAFNNPMRFIDPDGRGPEDRIARLEKKLQEEVKKVNDMAKGLMAGGLTKNEKAQINKAVEKLQNGRTLARLNKAAGFSSANSTSTATGRPIGEGYQIKGGFKTASSPPNERIYGAQGGRNDQQNILASDLKLKPDAHVLNTSLEVKTTGNVNISVSTFTNRTTWDEGTSEPIPEASGSNINRTVSPLPYPLSASALNDNPSLRTSDNSGVNVHAGDTTGKVSITLHAVYFTEYKLGGAVFNAP